MDVGYDERFLLNTHTTFDQMKTLCIFTYSCYEHIQYTCEILGMLVLVYNIIYTFLKMWFHIEYLYIICLHDYVLFKCK